MKDIPLTPGHTVFSACMIKAAGTNEKLNKSKLFLIMSQDLVFVKTFANTVMYSDYLAIPEVRGTYQLFGKCKSLNACVSDMGVTLRRLRCLEKMQYVDARCNIWLIKPVIACKHVP